MPRGIGFAKSENMAPSIDRHKVLRNEQPINWPRAFIVGFIGASMMMAFIDIFAMMGWTTFSFEKYLGSILWVDNYGPRAWVVGLMANWFLGGIFGILYGYFFEYTFRRANVSVGLVMGLIHAAVAALAFFPFFSMIHQFFAESGVGDQAYGTPFGSGFGFFGAGLGPLTFVLLLGGHMLFGATMGLLYGPVRAERIRMREFEPGEYGLPGEKGVIAESEDPTDRLTSTDEPEDRLAGRRKAG